MDVVTVPGRLPLVFLSNGVLLPGTSIRMNVSSSKNVNAIRRYLLSRMPLSEAIIGVVPVSAGLNLEKLSRNLLEGAVATAAVVVQVSGTEWPSVRYSLMVTGLARIRILKVLMEAPNVIASVEQLGSDLLMSGEEAAQNSSSEVTALMSELKAESFGLLSLIENTSNVPLVVSRLRKAVEGLPEHQLADLLASTVKASFAEKLAVLEAIDLKDRCEKALVLVKRQTAALNGMKSGSQPRSSSSNMFGKTLKKFNIFSGRNGGGDDDVEELEELEAKLNEAKMPARAMKTAQKELSRLQKMSPQMPEYPMLRHYLELLAELPWNKASKESIHLNTARMDLEKDHHGMESVKDRILEYLAVRKLKNSLKGPILCFVGPPGVGKTSIGRSIAKTTGRKFHRISLGGVSDQSEIRGHRRTYIGSMPGKIIQGLKTVGEKNPVFLLDEIDKMTAGLHGDPASALLEVLDPEQNSTFVDHYLNLPFDLSQVLFIATANTLKTIPGPLRDRMEIIEISGYSQEEKVAIAEKHLVPKQIEHHGLSSDDFDIRREGITFIVSAYTREAGVRMLERRLGALCRAVAVQVAEEKQKRKVHLDEKAIERILGPPLNRHAFKDRVGVPGVAVGLAWTVLGGEIMIVEATKMAGEGKLTLTGQLGDVMKESATIALNWIRAQWTELDLSIAASALEALDVHIHFPAGAVGKDGPSAGVTIVAALVSLFKNRTLKEGLAMTGEITLRGVVLPVGGIKEKVLSAHREGINHVILPQGNEKDLDKVPRTIREKMTFSLVRNVEELLKKVLPEGGEDASMVLDIDKLRPLNSKL